MKLHLHLPLLLAAISLSIVTATSSSSGIDENNGGNDKLSTEQSSSSSSTSSSSNPFVSMDINRDSDHLQSQSQPQLQQQQQQQSRHIESSDIKMSESSPYASYSTSASSSSSSSNQEFGMRNQPLKTGNDDSSSSSSSSSSQTNYGLAYSDQPQQQSQQEQSQYHGNNDYGVYRISDPRKSMFEVFGNRGSASGSESSASTEMTSDSSPQHMYANGAENNNDNNNNNNNNNNNDNGGGSSGEFLPLSVEEAFRKYFPERKEPQSQADSSEDGSSGSGASASVPIDYTVSVPATLQSSPTKYVNTFVSEEQRSPPSASKEVFSIDSLREIVEKEPLARSNPFDPPSPPLSAFLPLPPEVAAASSSEASSAPSSSSSQAIISSQSIPQYSFSDEQQQQQPQQQLQQQEQREQQQQQPIYHQQTSAYGQAQAYVQHQHQQQQQQQQQQQPSQELAYNNNLPQEAYLMRPLQEPQSVSNNFIAYHQSQQQNEPLDMSPINSHTASSSAASMLGPIVSSPESSGSGTESESGSRLQSPPSSAPDSSEMPADDNEDEGSPYNTDILDENGKKVPSGFSQSIRVTGASDGGVSGENFGQRIPSTFNAEVDFQQQQQSQQQQQPIYQKPGMMTYGMNDDNERVPGFDQSIVPASAFHYGDRDIGNTSPQSSSAGPAPYQMYYTQASGNNADSVSPNIPQSSSQWSAPISSTENRPEFDSNGMPGRSKNIEYGGFVPIKKPGSGSGYHGPSDYTFDMSPPATGPDEYFSSSGEPSSYQPHRPQQQQQQQQQRPYQQQQQQQQMITYGSSSGQQSSGGGGNNYDYMQNGGQQKNQQGGNFASKFPNLRFKPLYGKDALRKLRELGISEEEFYGTVNKILQKSQSSNRVRGPGYKGNFMPKANMYRAPPKNGNGGGSKRPAVNAPNHKIRPIGNTIGEEFDFNYFKDGLPPGASYNPRDVGLDESVLAAIHLQDSGIGGYRFPTLIPMGARGPIGGVGGAAGAAPAKPAGYRANFGRFSSPFKKAIGKAGAIGSGAIPATAASGTVPYAMNSIALPYVSFAGGRSPMTPGVGNHYPHQSHHNRFHHRVPYSSNGKGFRSQYGYRAAAASELKPQFLSVPKTIPKFKFLSQSLPLKASPLLGGGGSSSGGGGMSSLEDPSQALSNILGIRSIKGIKSLVSYLTGGVQG